MAWASNEAMQSAAPLTLERQGVALGHNPHQKDRHGYDSDDGLRAISGGHRSAPQPGPRRTRSGFCRSRGAALFQHHFAGETGLAARESGPHARLEQRQGHQQPPASPRSRRRPVKLRQRPVTASTRVDQNAELVACRPEGRTARRQRTGRGSSSAKRAAEQERQGEIHYGRGQVDEDRGKSQRRPAKPVFDRAPGGARRPRPSKARAR